MPLLRCEGLTRAPWIRDVRLTVDEGEVVVLRGPSGSGKTLLLRALADLDPVEAGAVFLKDRERSTFTPSEWRSHVLYLHQEPVRLAGSVRDNVEAVTRLAVHSGSAGVVEIPRLSAEQSVRDLSGGEAQRLGLYRALGLAPDVLLLDEPTSGLDEEAARDAEDAVRRFVDDGHAVLWVSHDAALADRVRGREVAFP